MGTPHTMAQHLNLLNREPGLNCFTLPGNQGALHFSTGWRRRSRINQAWNTSLPSRRAHSPVSKDGKNTKSTSTWWLLLDVLYFQFDLILRSFGFMLRAFGQNLLWCTRIFQIQSQCILKQVFPRWARGTWYNCQSQLEVDNSWIGFYFCQAKVWEYRTAISWIFRRASESHSIHSWVTADVSIVNIRNPWVISFSILFLSLALPPNYLTWN